MSHFHILTKHWIDTRLTGAEMYHSQLAKWLESEGHTVTHGDKVPAGCNTVITTPFPHYHDAIRSGKRVVFIQHNENRDPYNFTSAGVIYCAKHVAKTCGYRCADSVVFYPFNRYAGSKSRNWQIGSVLLTNCNENKGGKQLIELAKLLPRVSFIGINGGYGNQRTGEVENLEYVAPVANIVELFAQTCALLILSKKEGLPTVALEAMSFGVPVVALDIPGTREAVGEYVFPNLAAIRAELERLSGDPDYYYALSVTSVARAKEVEETRDWEGLRRVLGISNH